jgi:hypothetical protein
MDFYDAQDMFLNHLIRDISCTPSSINYRPEVSPPT